MGVIANIARQFGYELTRTSKCPGAFDVQRMLINIDDPLICDVGAHVGEVALRYRSDFPQASIHCFEPFEKSFAELQSRVEADPLVELHQLALSDRVGRALLHVNRSSGTNSLLPSDSRASSYWGENHLETQRQVEVELCTLDEFCLEQSIPRINILKLDVQGGEYAVLTGAKKMLTHQAIDLIYMEMIAAPTYGGQYKLHEYLAFFDSVGYELFDFYNSVRASRRLIQTDNLFVSREFLDQFETSLRTA